MISAFISAFFFFFNYIAHQEIVVEHKYLPRIEASSIADEVISFDLEQNYSSIHELIITEEYYFIAPSDYENKGFPKSVSKLDKSGKYIEEIYRITEKGMSIRDIDYDEANKRLIITDGNKLISFDIVKNKIVKEVELDRAIYGIKTFNSKLYVSGCECSESSKTFYLESYDPINLKIINIEKEINYKAEQNNPLDAASRYSTLSINNNQLFLSMGQVNEIYSSADGFKNPIITFKNIYKNKPSYGNIIFSSNQGMIGKFTTTGFNYLNNWYVYYYDLKNNKQYLSKTGDNSGLYDDITNLGYIRSPHFTNSNEYMFTSKKNKSNDKGITIILLKIKS